MIGDTKPHPASGNGRSINHSERKFTRRWSPRTVVLSFGALAALSVRPVDAASISVFVLAPNPPQSINNVEKQGADKALFSHDYSFPYAVVEPLIQKEIRNKIDGVRSGVVNCPSVCPDVHWKINIKSAFAFTNKNEPVLKPFGDPQQNGLDVALATQMRLHLDVEATAWIKPVTGTVEKTVHVPIDLLIDFDAASRLNLWPVIQSHTVSCPVTQKQETACVKLTLAGKNVDLSGVNGAAIELGAELDTIIGATPIGPLIGGPLGGLLVGALGGNEAAEQAKARIQAEVGKALTTQLQVASIQATAMAGKYIDARLMTANNLKDKLFNTKIPQINKSFQELSDSLGIGIDVQTVSTGNGLNVIVTPRFGAAPGGAQMSSKIRMPKEACVYAESEIGRLPVGFLQINQDLSGKGGSSCSVLLNGSEVKSSGYLGADPKAAKFTSAKPLPAWHSVGTSSFTGQVADYSNGKPASSHTTTGYYECRMTTADLPRAGIVELALSGKLRERLADYGALKPRYFEVSALGLHATLDSDWKPGEPTIGGEASCKADVHLVRTFDTNAWLNRVKDVFDPNKCPNCNIQMKDGLLMVTNPEPFLQNPAVKKMLSAVQRGQPLPAATPAASLLQGTSQAPARSPQQAPESARGPTVPFGLHPRHRWAATTKMNESLLSEAPELTPFSLTATLFKQG